MNRSRDLTPLVRSRPTRHREVVYGGVVPPIVRNLEAFVIVTVVALLAMFGAGSRIAGATGPVQFNNGFACGLMSNQFYGGGSAGGETDSMNISCSSPAARNPNNIHVQGVVWKVNGTPCYATGNIGNTSPYSVFVPIPIYAGCGSGQYTFATNHDQLVWGTWYNTGQLWNGGTYNFP
jgi:hypothetical protein